jgi:hypothetical protein
VKRPRHKLVVFTAQSKNQFYCRDAVCEYVIRAGAVPLNPFRVFDYFLSDRVEREAIREGNNELIHIADEVWVFGETIADGVFAEIALASDLGKPIRLFSIAPEFRRIHPIKPSALHFEHPVYGKTKLGRNDLLRLISRHLDHAQPDQLDMFDDRDS